MQDAVVSVLRLSRVAEVRITPEGIDVKRQIEDEEAVIPESIRQAARDIDEDMPDTGFLLSNITVESLPLDPERHALTTLIAMMSRLHERGLYPSAWYVARGDTLDAFLGQAEGTLPSFLFGVPVYYVEEDHVPEGRLVLIGSRTRYAIDTVYGITADIGG